jgi:hypothetical protein
VQHEPDGAPDREPVELWEVDWDFDGRLFRSRAQAARAWRSGRLEEHLVYAGDRRPGQKLAVRVTDRLGRVGISQLSA